MPIPKPRKNENKNEFIDRCMGDDKMVSEYTDNKQRLAVCNVSWKDKDKKSRGNMTVDKSKFKTEGVERRFTPQVEAEIRVSKDEDGLPVVEGYFAKFGKLSGNLGGFREKIDKGFFRSALQESDTLDLFNHDQNYPLGRESAPGPEGKLELWEDEVGLRYKLIPLVTNTIKDMVLIPIEKKVIKGNSFGFRTKNDGDMWENDRDGMPIRTLKADGCESLIDGSQVTFPAYPDTGLALRSLNTWSEARGDEGKDDDSANKASVGNDNNKIIDIDNDGTEVVNPKDESDDKGQEHKINLDVPVNLKLNVTIEQENNKAVIEEESEDDRSPDHEDDDNSSSDENDDDQSDNNNGDDDDNQQASSENVNEDQNEDDDEQKPSEAKILAKQRDRELQLKKKLITMED